jgi:hypothetical protein
MSNILKTLAAGSVSGEYQISRSLRFNSADTAYLSRTPASAGDRKTWTWSGWVKISPISTFRTFFSADTGSPNPFVDFSFQNDNTIQLDFSVSSGRYQPKTTAVYRDPSAWYHVVVAVDTTQATEANRAKVYVNGVQQTTSAVGIPPNTDLSVNNTVVHNIGRRAVANDSYFNGYLADINFIDGQALTPSSFGETNETTGVWSPIKFNGPWNVGTGVNGFYLKFSNNSDVTAATLGADYSGNGNNWTPSGSPGFSVTAGAGNDSLVDTPTQYGTDTGAGGEVRGNYATLNPLAKDADITLANGNLDFSCSSAGLGGTIGTIAVTSGKWYWEVTPTSGTSGFALGIAKLPLSAYDANQTGTYLYLTGGNKRLSPSTDSAYGASYTDNDVIGVALDMDAGTVTFYKNNASQGTAFSSLSGEFTAWVQDGSNGIASVANINFGQRPFAYTAPSGFKALVTTNLPEPTVVQGDDYFNTVLYTGNDGTQTITTGIDMATSGALVWFKNRSANVGNILIDPVRGYTKNLESNSTRADDTFSFITSTSSTGFTMNTGSSAVNGGVAAGGPFNYVAWNWKADGAGVSNGDGTISGTVTVSANTIAGISIVTYTGTGVVGATVGHGLGAVPAMMIVKSRSAVSNWLVYHKGVASDPQTDYLTLETTNAVTDNAGPWNDTAPTSSVFTIGDTGWTNTNTATYVAYCFAEVEGFSKFGSFVGNGSTDGAFVYLGFRPAFVMLKDSSVGGVGSNWGMFDNDRLGYNSFQRDLRANVINAEGTDNDLIDFLSNGFKIRSTSSGFGGGSGTTYIFMAFAENPFKYSLAR